MKEPNKIQQLLYRLSDNYWSILHKLGRHRWAQVFEKDIVITNGVVAHQDGTPPITRCDICSISLTFKKGL